MSRPKPMVKYEAPLWHRKTPREMLKAPLSTECDAGRDNIFKVRRDTIAIVFVPGIMGSKLRKSNGLREPVWIPDNLEFMLKSYLFADPKKRYELLIKDPLEVMHDASELLERYPKAAKRGWGSVAWSFYGDLLSGLQNWGSPLKALLDLPVYAFGYNWLKSNKESGIKLRQAILSLKNVQKVIIVTHSMGGLVARAALGDDGGEAIADKVLGVIHGAQPVHGAPVAYRRQIAGQEVDGFFNILGILGAQVLGADGPAITAIFPHAPGALELLPSQHYRTNAGRKEWLHIQDPDNPKACVSYPQNGDPYEEIYLKGSHRDFWGMIHGDWFQPLPEDAETLDRVLYGTAPLQPHDRYSVAFKLKKYLRNAREFHGRIGQYSHPRTVQYFSSGGHATCSEISWQAKTVTETVNIRPEPERGDRKPLGGYACLRDIENIRKQSRGEYSEVRWRDAEGKLGDRVPWETPFAELDRGIRQGKRLWLHKLSEIGEKGPGMADERLCHLGDGTVPLSSATGLAPDCNTWGGATLVLPFWEGPAGTMLTATGSTNQSEHSAFYDPAAIQATINAIHNLCLGWLKEEF